LPNPTKIKVWKHLVTGNKAKSNVSVNILRLERLNVKEYLYTTKNNDGKGLQSFESNRDGERIRLLGGREMEKGRVKLEEETRKK